MTGTADLDNGNVPWVKFSYDLGKPRKPPDAAEQACARPSPRRRNSRLRGRRITVPGWSSAWCRGWRPPRTARLSAAARRQGRSRDRHGSRRHRAAVVGQGAVRDAARHPRRSARQRLDDGRRQLARDQVLAARKGAARHRRRRTTLAVPNNFCSTTDIAFAANGHVFISDGYANARILEYSADGQKVREWGTPGTGPGQFVLPHSIQIDAAGLVYVADRENGRVQRFDQTGKYRGEWSLRQDVRAEGRTAPSCGSRPRPLQQPNLSPGLAAPGRHEDGQDRRLGAFRGNHGMDVMVAGELLVGPGPNPLPQRYRRVPEPTCRRPNRYPAGNDGRNRRSGPKAAATALDGTCGQTGPRRPADPGSRARRASGSRAGACLPSRCSDWRDASRRRTSRARSRERSPWQRAKLSRWSERKSHPGRKHDWWRSMKPGFSFRKARMKWTQSAVRDQYMLP